MFCDKMVVLSLLLNFSNCESESLSMTCFSPDDPFFPSAPAPPATTILRDRPADPDVKLVLFPFDLSLSEALSELMPPLAFLFLLFIGGRPPEALNGLKLC